MEGRKALNFCFGGGRKTRGRRHIVERKFVAILWTSHATPTYSAAVPPTSRYRPLMKVSFIFLVTVLDPAAIYRNAI
jgi:hypothetical protein